MTISSSRFLKMVVAVAVLLLARGGTISQAADNDYDSQGACNQLPSHDALRSALVVARMAMNGGFNLDMWGTVVNRDGIVCAVAFTGSARGDQWPGSRVISAQSEYSECFQPAASRAFNRGFVQRNAAGRKSVWPAGEQSGEHEGCVCGRSGGLRPEQ